MGTGDEWFTSEEEDVEGELLEKVEGNIRIWAMLTKTEEDKYLFHLVELGRDRQCYFLHEKNWT